MRPEDGFWYRIEKKIKTRWPRYRFFNNLFSAITIGVVLPAFYCVIASHMQSMEWADSHMQRGEAVCVRSKRVYATPPMAWVNSAWENTYRIAGVERTAQERESCTGGKRYRLNYQIGDTGKLRIESGRML